MSAGPALAVDASRPVSVGRIRSLDGLRALSILLVFLGHLDGTRHFASTNIDVWLGDIAHLGVITFFVISGFVITGLLKKECQQSGRVSLKLFYLRRLLRIFPACYLFLGVVGMLWAAGIVKLHRSDILHALTYTVNYNPQTSWYVGHLWSLSIEEQFYLLWPFAFAALGPRRSLWVAAAMIILAPFARLSSWYFLRGTEYAGLPIFPVVADSLAAGCLLAGLQEWLERQNWYVRLFRPQFSIVMLTVVFLINRALANSAVYILGMGVINVLVAVLIHRSVYQWRDLSGRFLNWEPVAFIGALSYSLYLWQQLFINRNSSAWVSAFPQNLLLSICLALLSYSLVEKPLMGLRHRLRTT